MWIKVNLAIALMVAWLPLMAATLQDNGNGTVSDLATALVWQQQDDNVQRDHAAATDYCQTLPLAGSNDWRLPHIKELDSIVDSRVRSPSIDSDVFTGTNSLSYWSASSVASDSGSAWFLNFGSGNVGINSKIGDAYVRCVR